MKLEWCISFEEALKKDGFEIGRGHDNYIVISYRGNAPLCDVKKMMMYIRRNVNQLKLDPDIKTDRYYPLYNGKQIEDINLIDTGFKTICGYYPTEETEKLVYIVNS